MEKDIYIFGDITRKGYVTVSTDHTIKQILTDAAEGMANNKGLKLVQVGGPLGTCISRHHINDHLNRYTLNLRSNTMLFLNDSMCPVDFARFLTTYVLRELKVTSDRIEELAFIVDKISEGTATETDLERLLADAPSAPYPESDLAVLIKFLATEFNQEFLDHIIHRRCKAGICRRLFKSQCINACPAAINVPGFVALMAEGRRDEAYGIMRQNSPFSFVCGRICSRPCEAACRRGQIEDTFGVRALKAYTTNMALEIANYKETKLNKNGKKVAVIGAGLAGLTGAYFLAKTGYEVVVYEAANFTGGKIPLLYSKELLPKEIIDNEVQLIKNLGVTIRTETTVGKDLTINNLKDAFEAVLLATGQRKDINSADEKFELTENGFIDIDPKTHETNQRGVFAAGDIHRLSSPPGVIAEAKRAAEAIDKYLEGNGLYLGEEIEIPEPQLHHGIWDIKPAADLESIVTKEDANREAQRCLRCDRNSRKRI